MSWKTRRIASKVLRHLASPVLRRGVVNVTTSATYTEYPRLTPKQVNEILTRAETSQPINLGVSPMRRVDANRLPSNNPVEDFLSVCILPWSDAVVMAVFDGHGGPACAHAVSQRLSDYIAVASLSQAQLARIVMERDNRQTQPYSLFAEPLMTPLRPHYAHMHRKRLNEFADARLLSGSDPRDPSISHEWPKPTIALREAMLRLDEDLGREALPENKHDFSLDTLAVAFTGCTCCVALVTSTHVHVANAGDCKAVIAQADAMNPQDGAWTALPLSNDHKCSNPAEIARLKAAHPDEDLNLMLADERLLGTLEPLRAFGDFQYKWAPETLDNAIKIMQESGVAHPYRPSTNIYKTPPYLTVEPEIISHRLDSTRDQALILASDGLWDFIDPETAVALMQRYFTTQEVNDPFVPPHGVSLSELVTMLDRRAELARIRCQDSNAATHLMRLALGFSDSDGDKQKYRNPPNNSDATAFVDANFDDKTGHLRLSNLLSVPGNSRSYRDDISIFAAPFCSKVILEHTPHHHSSDDSPAKAHHHRRHHRGVSTGSPTEETNDIDDTLKLT